MRKPFHTVMGGIILVAACLSAQAQSASKAIKISGDVSKPLNLGLADLRKMPVTEVVGREKDGRERRFRGVAVAELLNAAGAPTCGQLRGENLAKFVVVYAADKYRAVFALPELDSSFTDRPVVLAYEADGKPLAEAEGQLRIVVPHDKKHARWVRQVTEITVKKAQ